jgi:hypothetical protein
MTEFLKRAINSNQHTQGSLFSGPPFSSSHLYLSGLGLPCLQDSGQRNNVFSRFFFHVQWQMRALTSLSLEACDLVPDMLGSSSGLRGMMESGRLPLWSRPQKLPPSRPSEPRSFKLGLQGLGSCQAPFNPPALLAAGIV